VGTSKVQIVAKRELSIHELGSLYTRAAGTTALAGCRRKKKGGATLDIVRAAHLAEILKNQCPGKDNW